MGNNTVKSNPALFYAFYIIEGVFTIILSIALHEKYYS